MCDAEEYASLFLEKFLKEIIKSTKGVMRFEILLSKYLFGLEIISHKLFCSLLEDVIILSTEVCPIPSLDN